MRVVFLDRDGVINENRADHVKSWAEFRFLPGALAALRLLTQAEFRIFVVTNQAIVNRGVVAAHVIAEIHQHLQEQAAAQGATITAVRYCPHRPDERCSCRKPQPGMLQSLADEYGFDPHGAYLVGDALSDIAAGKALGCHNVLVRTGRGSHELALMAADTPPPDYVANDLYAAAQWVLNAEFFLSREAALAA
jgi:D-glycero-D-manno-heptose 1,7-bisphosphate phosphatase